MPTTTSLVEFTAQRLVSEFCEPASTEADTMWWILERGEGAPLRLAVQLGHEEFLLGLIFDPDMPQSDAAVTFIIRYASDVDALIRNIRLAVGDAKE